jgi:hypothetical protein
MDQNSSYFVTSTYNIQATTHSTECLSACIPAIKDIEAWPEQDQREVNGI